MKEVSYTWPAKQNLNKNIRFSWIVQTISRPLHSLIISPWHRFSPESWTRNITVRIFKGMIQLAIRSCPYNCVAQCDYSVNMQAGVLRSGSQLWHASRPMAALLHWCRSFWKLNEWCRLRIIFCAARGNSSAPLPTHQDTHMCNPPLL